MILKTRGGGEKSLDIKFLVVLMVISKAFRAKKHTYKIEYFDYCGRIKYLVNVTF